MEDEEDDEEGSAPIEDLSILTFSKHTDSLFCGSINPDGTLAVTGGEDDKAYVWSIETGEVLFEVTEHKDSVISAEFSHDGAYVATGDMAGDVKVFKTDKEFKKVWEFSMGDMSWMKWHRKSNVLFAGSENGEIYIWRIPSGDCKVLQGAGNTCEVAVFTHDDKSLAAGYFDGTFKLWDVKTQQVTLNIPPHSSGDDEDSTPPPTITTIDTDRENNVIIAGSVDGNAKLIGPHGLIGVLPIPKKENKVSPVESVLIDCPSIEIKIAATATLEGKVHIWDVGRQTIRFECKDESPHGITRLKWAPEKTILAGTLSGDIKAWDARNGDKKFTLTGHADNVNDIFYHEKKDLLLTVSDDKTAKLFKLNLC